MVMATGKLLEVATPAVDGVTIKRHLLDSEAATMAMLCRRIGKRLRRWLREMPEHKTCVRPTGERDDDGNPIMEVIHGSDGKPLQEPFLPDEDFRENFRFYTVGVLGLLKEQRERAKLVGKHGAPPVSDEVFEQQIAELARAAVLEMPKAELEALIRQRAVDVSVGDTMPADDGSDPRLKL